MVVEEHPFSELLSAVIDNRGKTCPTVDSGIPLIATNCIRNELLYPTYDKVRFVSKETYNNWFRGHPLPGDIIFVNKATPGRVCLVPDPVDFCIAQDMVAVRADPKRVYPKYLFAVLRSPAVQEKIGQMHVGTLIPHFKKGDFDKLLLPIPDRKTQEFIGDTYFALSAKIDVNRRMNATLELMARALFKSWFVDFDPVHAKMDGRQPAGMDAETAALFPSAFQESELGLIPEGWRVAPIGDVVECVGGGTPSTSEPAYWDGGVHSWATPKDMSALQAPVLLSTERRLTDAGLTKVSSGILPIGTVLMSSRAPVGYLAIAQIPVAVNQGFIAMKCNEVASNYFILHWCQANMAAIEERATGTTFAEISKQNFRPIPFLVPSVDVMMAFTRQAELLYRHIALNVTQSVLAGETRDALLPKLLNGEVRAG